jgi:hypothetical protein
MSSAVLLLLLLWTSEPERVNGFSSLSAQRNNKISSLLSTTSTTSTITIATTRSRTSMVLFAKSRKARRQEKKEGLGRSRQFYEALEQAGANTPKDGDIKQYNTTSNGSSGVTATVMKEKEEEEEDSDYDDQKLPPPREDPAAQARRDAIQQDAEKRYQQRPEVSTMIVDEETGTEVLAQGQKVMDIVTRKAVQLKDTPEERLAQMFPAVPPEIRNKYRVDWRSITVPEMVEQLKEATYVTLKDGTRGVPPHPSVASKAIDFVLANRDYLGPRMKKTLGRWTMHHASKGDWDSAQEWKKVWDNYLILENLISAPFRQILQDAEGRVGPNFGNLDMKSFCKGDLYQRIGNYLVLKGMVAHWEKKVVDANFYEKTPQPEENYMRWLATGDPKRYLAEPPILWTLAECAQVCGKAQEMCQLFVQDEDLVADFPPEIVFLEEALKIKGGTALRKFMIEEFCPERGITPEALREGMRRFHHQLDSMQIDPYGDLTNKVELLYRAMAIGTDDERDAYEKYLGIEANTDPNNPGYFETYTFYTSKYSLLRFLDSQYPGKQGFFEMVGPTPTKSEAEETSSNQDDNPFALDNPFDLSNLLGGKDDSSGSSGNPFETLFGGLTGVTSNEKQLRFEPDPDEQREPYETPEIRAIGRRYELGWLEKLAELDNYKASFANVQPGRIIPDDEA